MLKWVFGADTSPFRRSLNEMRSDVKQFSASAKSQLAGIFGIGAITAWVSATLEAAGKIADLSSRLDMTAESFQRLSYASTLSGGSMDTVGKGLTILTRKLEDAKNGGDSLATSAAALNLNLSELAGMSPEQQMIQLSRGYAQSADKGAALTAVVDLLGKSGGDIVPMLVAGPEALAATMDEAAIATNAEIAAMDALGDKVDAFKMKSVAALGSMISGVQVWGAYLEKIINKTFGDSGTADKMFEKRMDSILGNDPAQSDAKAKASEATEAAAKQLKIEEEKAKLSETIAKLEEEARIRSLSLTEKILDAEKRRAELAAESIFGDDEVKALEARKSQLEIEKDIAGYRKEQAENNAQIEEKRKESAEEINALSEKGFEIDRANSLASMSEEDKRDYLSGERDQLLKSSKEAAKSGDEKRSLELSNKAKELTGEIDGITKSLGEDLRAKLEDERKRVPTIATSSLADIGGGGGSRLINNDSSRRMVDLLAQIASNTAGGDQGARPPEPI